MVSVSTLTSVTAVTHAKMVAVSTRMDLTSKSFYKRSDEILF